MPSAVFIVDAGVRRSESAVAAAENSGAPPCLRTSFGHLSFHEVLGRSVIGRMVENLVRAGFDSTSVFVDRSFVPHASEHASETSSYLCEDAWRDAGRQLTALKGSIDVVLLAGASTYTDCDWADALRFHRDHGEAVTRACDQQGPLDMWFLDPCRISCGEDLSGALQSAQPVMYELRGYVNRLENPRDLRRLAVDSLTGRCRLRPHGFEVRPGVWMGERAQVEREARIVPPVFIGRNVKISGQCLITRCTSVESNSYVDYGTVVEDSSILSNTYVGIGLDLSHSIVDGNQLFNLRHDVMLRITDPVIMRQGRAHGEVNRHLLSDCGLGEQLLASREPGLR